MSLPGHLGSRGQRDLGEEMGSTPRPVHYPSHLKLSLSPNEVPLTMVRVLSWCHESPLLQKFSLSRLSRFQVLNQRARPWFQKFPRRGPAGEKGGLLQLPQLAIVMSLVHKAGALVPTFLWRGRECLPMTQPEGPFHTHYCPADNSRLKLCELGRETS